MDSVSAKAVANQKVFVPLSAVMEVAANFNRKLESIRVAEQSVDTPNVRESTRNTKAQARGMAQVIRDLGLPIELPNGY